MKWRVGFLIFCFQYIWNTSSSGAAYPQLPQILINTHYDPPNDGELIKVNTSNAFQSALNTAELGDIIELQAGTTYIGPFTLPNKTAGTGWIYIISSAYANLPPPCSRVSPSDVIHMPTLVIGANNGGTINTASNAHHYRFVGIEFKPVAGNFIYNIINIGNGETTASSQPDHLVFDRCYIHGDPAAGSRRGILLNGAYLSVIDSHISDCKEDGADSQALASYNSTGPIKIVNNYLEGAGENVIFGGSDPSIPDAVPSDIEIRCNHFFKPLTWMDELWDIKNLLEFKNAQRVLVEGNHFENCWPNAQSGFALLLTPRNQNNTAPWSVVQDITIRFNTFDNVAQGLNMSGYDAPNISQRTSRILVQNNVWNVTNLGSGGDGRMFQVLNGPTDVIFDHNTGFCTNAYMVSDGSPKTDNFVFSNNLVSYATYGFIGSGTGTANTTLAMYFNPNWIVTTNAIIGGSASGYPSGNYFPPNNTAVIFEDFNSGNYRLKKSSPYNNLGTDGKDLGADIDSIAIASAYECELPTVLDGPPVDEFIMKLYPVPADNALWIQQKYLLPGFIQLEIFNPSGQLMYSAKEKENNHFVDTSAFPDGFYVIQIQSMKNRVCRKFVVSH